MCSEIGRQRLYLSIELCPGDDHVAVAVIVRGNAQRRPHSRRCIHDVGCARLLIRMICVASILRVALVDYLRRRGLAVARDLNRFPAAGVVVEPSRRHRYHPLAVGVILAVACPRGSAVSTRREAVYRHGRCGCRGRDRWRAGESPIFVSSYAAWVVVRVALVGCDSPRGEVPVRLARSSLRWRRSFRADVSADTGIIVALATHASKLSFTLVVKGARLVTSFQSLCMNAWDDQQRSNEKQGKEGTATRHS
ncbi:hypothetical protein KC19_9G125900 [Ceratodon purpureus]|uniref:Uncharacterized protein n=1 Tax=Ceratodon purpureus TaxID=3225 RepID=A0A8T0GWU6_CERPU|nr:hypothetical protein KC19_9G125900 [Ceratodon purpureus]